MNSAATLDPTPARRAPAAGLFGAVAIVRPTELMCPANEQDCAEFVEDFLAGTHTHPLRDAANPPTA